ncbi:MAG: polymerase sigma70 factor [Thermoleophilia bacterium]|nr:polymerase sigma70 factor [Thermoleophilia bacterium]
MDTRTPTIDEPSTAASDDEAPGMAEIGGFDDVYERCAPRIFRYTRSRLGPAAAEDVTAEIFAVAWKARDKFTTDISDDPMGWLLGVANRVIARHRQAEYNWIRMCRETARASTDLPAATDDMSEVDDRVDAQAHHRVLAAVAHIPERERIPLLMLVVSEMSYEDIAASLRIPIGTVKSRISRARARLQDRIGMEEGE